MPQATAAVTVTADPATCSFQGNPVAREIDFKSSCDIAKRYLVQNSVSYDNVAGAPGSKAIVKIGDKTIEAPDRHRGAAPSSTKPRPRTSPPSRRPWPMT